MCRSAESGGGRKSARPFVSRLTGDHSAAPPRECAAQKLLFRFSPLSTLHQGLRLGRPNGSGAAFFGRGPASAGPRRLMVEWSALCARLLWGKNSKDPKKHKDFHNVGRPRTY